MKVAVVGGGPAGALLACHLARDGAAVTLFDASHPREKPCGGGLTAKALALLPAAPANDPLPVRWVEACRFESGTGEGVELGLGQPVAVGARRDVDAWILRRAVEAGATHEAARVVGVDASGTVRTALGRSARFDLVVGADGAGSPVRRTFWPRPARAVAGGPRLVRAGPSPRCALTPGCRILWLFPAATRRRVSARPSALCPRARWWGGSRPRSRARSPPSPIRTRSGTPTPSPRPPPTRVQFSSWLANAGRS